MNRAGGIFLGIGALIPGIVAGVTFSAGLNVYYAFHPVYFVGTAIAGAVAYALGRASLRALGVGGRARRAIPALLLVGWTGAFFVLSWTGYPDRAAAARRNGAVIRTLPRYPGLRFDHRHTWGKLEADVANEGFINPPDELLTTWTWRVPFRVPVSVLAGWYLGRLRGAGWQVGRDDVGDGSIDLVASRRGVEVEIDVLPATRAMHAATAGETRAGRVDATAG
jgi:hypothetical protein